MLSVRERGPERKNELHRKAGIDRRSRKVQW